MTGTYCCSYRRRVVRKDVWRVTYYAYVVALVAGFALVGKHVGRKRSRAVGEMIPRARARALQYADFQEASNHPYPLPATNLQQYTLSALQRGEQVDPPPSLIQNEEDDSSLPATNEEVSSTEAAAAEGGYFPLPSYMQKYTLEALLSEDGINQVLPPLLEEEEEEDENPTPPANQVTMTEDGVEIGHVKITDPAGNYDLGYFRCGPKFDQQQVREILLLHSDSSNEVWYSSKILQKLCSDNTENQGMSFSVTAIDLDPFVGADQLSRAFEGLTNGFVLSGSPLTVVSPSTSGKGIVNLAEADEEKKRVAAHWKMESSLSRIVQAWVPISCSYVLTTNTALREFLNAHIPVLAVYGSDDSVGKQTFNRLSREAGAKAVQLGRQHACYLDDPDQFVRTLKSFVIENGKETVAVEMVPQDQDQQPLTTGTFASKLKAKLLGMEDYNKVPQLRAGEPAMQSPDPEAKLLTEERDGIEKGYAKISDSMGSYQLEYYHCGPKFTSTDGPDDNGLVEEAPRKNIREILLLNGSTFVSKESWHTSDFLRKLCGEADAANPPTPISVTAIDLGIDADATKVMRAFECLRDNGILSGLPLTVVSPSNSGTGIINLAEVVEQKRKAARWKIDNVLSRVVKAWVPIACTYVLTTNTALNEFRDAQIPVLAMYGSDDGVGRQAADLLKRSTAARVVQLGRQHLCYLDDPYQFVQILISFVDEVQK